MHFLKDTAAAAMHYPKVSPWLYFLLAHLVADFVLQPSALVKLKRQPVGLVIHSGVHAVIAVALVAPFLPRWWVMLPFLGITHYFIDRTKVESGNPHGPASLAWFLLDQAVHLGVLALAVIVGGLSLAAQVSYGSAALTAGLYYAVPYVAATFAGAILIYQIALAFHTRSAPEELLAPRLRIAGMVERGITLTVVLFLAPSLWWLGGVSYSVRLWTERDRPRRWPEALSGFAFAAALGFLFRHGPGR